jgi:hypothetical protein
MSDNEITPRHLDILLKTVGLDRANTPYRNARVVAKGHEAEAELAPLVAIGYLAGHEYALREHHMLYQATPLGISMARFEAQRRKDRVEAQREAERAAQSAQATQAVAAEYDIPCFTTQPHARAAA